MRYMHQGLPTQDAGIVCKKTFIFRYKLWKQHIAKGQLSVLNRRFGGKANQVIEKKRIMNTNVS